MVILDVEYKVDGVMIPSKKKRSALYGKSGIFFLYLLLTLPHFTSHVV